MEWRRRLGFTLLLTRPLPLQTAVTAHRRRSREPAMRPPRGGPRGAAPPGAPWWLVAAHGNRLAGEWGPARRPAGKPIPVGPRLVLSWAYQWRIAPRGRIVALGGSFRANPETRDHYATPETRDAKREA